MDEGMLVGWVNFQSGDNHTTKITVTFVISHFDILWYYKNPIPFEYHIFWLPVSHL